jgi:hypothetical protein
MIAMAVAVLAGLLAQGASRAGPEAGPSEAWILTCDMPRPEAAADKRVFRIAPKFLAEWNASANAFGYNLCDSFPCVVRTDRLEGVISSPTVVLTISLDRAAGTAAWRAQGASGLSRTSGACAIRPDAAAKKP